MLTSSAFVAKAIEFLLTKVAARQLDLAMDEKKRAAKAFVRLHEAVVELQQSLHSFLLYIEGLKTGRNSKIFTVHTKRFPVEDASRELLESFEQLESVLRIYDPVLLVMFGGILHRKKLLMMGIDVPAEDLMLPEGNHLYFTVNDRNDGLSSLDFTVPDDSVISTSPNQLFSTRAIKDYIRDLHIEPFEIDRLIHLYPGLKKQSEYLEEAREQLRKFIEKHFSLSDILYVLPKKRDGP